jgi:hypothetical protein
MMTSEDVFHFLSSIKVLGAMSWGDSGEESIVCTAANPFVATYA